MNLEPEAARHLRALVRLVGENPDAINSITFNLNKGTVSVTRKKGVGVADTTQKTEGWVYTERPGVVDE